MCIFLKGLVENPIAEQNASTSYQHNIEQIATEKEKFNKPLIRCVPTPKLIDFTLPFRDYPVKGNLYFISNYYNLLLCILKNFNTTS